MKKKKVISMKIYERVGEGKYEKMGKMKQKNKGRSKC